MDGPEDPVITRLLADAERHAADGQGRTALLLLAWASRVASRSRAPDVLLSYHRVRAALVAAEPLATRSDAPPRGDAGTGVHERVAGLGFPAPRFPAHPPELDRDAFIPPAPRVISVPMGAAPERPIQASRRFRGRGPAVLGLALLTCTVMAAPGLRAILRVGAGVDEPAEITTRAERALAAGDPGSALAIAERAHAPQPRLLLVRGKALAAMGDTSRAAAELRRVGVHPAATAAEAVAAARTLAAWPGQENAAADGYVQAFAAGLPESEWPEVMEALRRAGRGREADRVAGLLGTRKER